jgi:putative membrane protein
MALDIALAYLHFVALIGTVSLLVAELLLCRPGIAGDALHRLKRVDVAYAAFAVATLATGAMRVAWGAKGSAFYLGNPVFHAKVGLFVLVGLLSIVPTIRFIRWSKAALASGAAPGIDAVATARRWLHAEAALLAVLPLLAATMARGIGHLGT